MKTLREITEEAAISFADPERTEHEAEEAECAHMHLDDQGVPRISADGRRYSLVGRIMAYARGASCGD